MLVELSVRSSGTRRCWRWCRTAGARGGAAPLPRPLVRDTDQQLGSRRTQGHRDDEAGDPELIRRGRSTPPPRVSFDSAVP